MKYTTEEYKQELEKVYHITCNGAERDRLMRPFYTQLHQGLEVGDGVTLNMWSDSHAATITRRTAHTLWVNRDKATLVTAAPLTNFGGNQDYTYETDPITYEEKCVFSQKRGCFMWGGKPISVGRHEHYDYSF